MKYDQLRDRLEQAKSVLVTLTAGELPDGQKLSDLSIDELETIITTTDKFFKSVQSAVKHLASPRHGPNKRGEMNSQMSENVFFVLVSQFDNDPDPIPSEIWAFRNQIDAENFLQCWSVDYLGGFTHDASDLPLPDGELVSAFAGGGAHIHLYECRLDGDSYEIPLFASASQREAVS